MSSKRNAEARPAATEELPGVGMAALEDEHLSTPCSIVSLEKARKARHSDTLTRRNPVMRDLRFACSAHRLASAALQAGGRGFESHQLHQIAIGTAQRLCRRRLMASPGASSSCTHQPQRAMSERTGSTVVEAAGSHAIDVSQPALVAALIEQAASAVRGLTGCRSRAVTLTV